VVEDLQADPRFSQLGVTTSAPYIRFYAGAPVIDANGLPLGSVCVLDTKPNSLDFRGLMTLSRFAAMAGAVLATRRLAVDLLETMPSPSANETAMLRLDRILIPLFEKLGGARGHHS
jgi:GAF domain-containing protein